MRNHAVFLAVVGATKVGQMDGFIRTLLSCIFRLPQFVPQNHRFDLLVLVS